MNGIRHHGLAFLPLVLFLVSCSDSDMVFLNDSPESDPETNLDARLQKKIAESDPDGLDGVRLPGSTEYDLIPQDPGNPITREKVVLGKFLFHDTALASGVNADEQQTWSCATCHHAAAGFKAGIPQGIGEGGIGFGVGGSERTLDQGFDANAEEGADNKPDLQPVASPAALNAAYQDVMLWNGQFGSSPDGINAHLSDDILSVADTPKAENARGLSGLEIQAIAGLAVHRLNVDDTSALHLNERYRELYLSAFGQIATDDFRLDAGLAIAAFERTILANRAPFQRWLNGDVDALTDPQKRGGILFFGKAGCSGCHQGPALSSKVGATESQVFFAIGMNDFDTDDERIHGAVDEATKEGRGGFTTDETARFKFKIPQLYNLADANVFGHGASFKSIKAVVKYKNNGIAQNKAARDFVDERFTPLGLNADEISDLTDFLTSALYDPNLARYEPASVPSGACVTVDPFGEGC